MLDGLGRWDWGSCASPRHHDEGTPASRQLHLLPGNVSRYQYLSSGKGTSYKSTVIIVGDLSMDCVTDCYIHKLEGHELQSDSCHCWLIWWTGAHANRCTWLAEFLYPLRFNCQHSRPGLHLKFLVFFMLLPQHQENYNLIFVIDRLKMMLHDEPMQIPIDVPRLPDTIDWVSVLTSKFWSPWYHFRSWLRLSPMRLLEEHSIRNLMTVCIMNIPHGFDIANPFPPDLWGYVHGFSYWLIYNLVWQTSLHRTWWGFEHGFVH